MASTVRDAVDSVLTPALRELRADIQADIQATNNSVKELRAELEALASATKQTRDQVDSVQAAAREDRRTVTDLRNQLERLTEKMTDIEDRSRRNNVRLVGLPEGSDMAGFLRVNLSKWIPSLKGRNIEVDRAHRVYDGRKNSDRLRTLIFRVLRWHDRSEILIGARQAYPVKCTQDNVTLLFFPDFSPATATRRKSLDPVLRTMMALGLQPFLAYPAVIKLRHGVSREVSTLFGKWRILSAPCHRRRHLLWLHKATGRRRPPSLRPGGRGLMAGIEAMPAARKKMVAGGIWMLARSLFSFFFPLSSWYIVHIYSLQLSLCW